MIMTNEMSSHRLQNSSEDGVSGNDLRHLVQELSRQVQAAEERSQAAEQRSNELAERVALLEEGTGDAAPRVGVLTTAISSAVSQKLLPKESQKHSKCQKSNIEKAVVAYGVEEEPLSDRLTQIEQQIEEFENFKDRVRDERADRLLESTFSLLITEHPCSIPFAFAVFTTALSTMCLGLTLTESISNGTKKNRLGIPVGVSNAVRAAQFLGALIGVLMEDEIPQGLQLIANAIGQKILLDGKKMVRNRVIISSIFRLAVGYLFLSSLFINIAQNSDVISIFYDVLALEFVENIDDTAYALAQRGFFGEKMLIATNKKHSLKLLPSDQSSLKARSSVHKVGFISSDSWAHHFARMIYFLNAFIVLGGLVYFTIIQKTGAYRCKTFTVSFDEVVWDGAYTVLQNGNVEKRLLIYSYFNGIYRETGTHDGYPVYTEQNKNDGTKFENTVGAQIRYCSEIEAWVFMHPNIKTSLNEGDENECSWLLRSPETSDFDISAVSDSGWDAWIGEIRPGSVLQVACNECNERSDCNYHGSCVDNRCECDVDRFGDHCEFELPCKFLASEKAQKDGCCGWRHENPIELMKSENTDETVYVYNRPVYLQRNLKGEEPFDFRKFDIRQVDKIPSMSPSTAQNYFESITDDAAQIEINDDRFGNENALSPNQPTAELSIHPTSNPTQWHKENIYKQNIPDFADWDDFFEAKSMHDLEDIMTDYSVALAFYGSRWFGTIIDSNSYGKIFHSDYHAYWSTAFSINRTFIISDVTKEASPVGIDFYEMRRRINNVINPNIEFSYGPFGALIPLMEYEGAGFFHCIVDGETNSTLLSPSQSPSKREFDGWR